MKWFGILLVVLAAGGAGLYYSRRLYRRAGLLRQTERLLAAMEGQMSFSAQPPASLCRALASSPALDSVWPLESVMAALEKGASFAEAFAAAVAAQRDILLPEEQRLLLEFAEGFGGSGMEQQLQRMSGYRAQIEECRRTAEKEAAQKGKIYQMMGVAAGVCAAVLML